MTTGLENIGLFCRFGTALLIGLLVGLQREYTHLRLEREEKSVGGTRTFALLGLLGCTAALLAEQLHSAWALSGGHAGDGQRRSVYPVAME